MKLSERLAKAAFYLGKQRGYTAVSKPHSNGVDLIVCDTNDNASIVFVAVMDTDYRKSIPIHGLGLTKAGTAREKALVGGARAWIAENGYKGPIRYDAVWVGDSFLHHSVNIINPLTEP